MASGRVTIDWWTVVGVASGSRWIAGIVGHGVGVAQHGSGHGK